MLNDEDIGGDFLHAVFNGLKTRSQNRAKAWATVRIDDRQRRVLYEQNSANSTSGFNFRRKRLHCADDLLSIRGFIKLPQVCLFFFSDNCCFRRAARTIAPPEKSAG